MTGLRITGATLLAMDGPPSAPLGNVRTADLLIEGDRIAAVGDASTGAAGPTLDARGLIAVPGFVQGHLHFCQTLFRGLADDLPLLDWLRERIWPLEAAHDARSTRASARLTAHELLRGGTTTVQAMESVRHTEETFAVLADVGLTAILGNCLMDRGGPGTPAGLLTSAAQAMRISEELRAAFDGRGRLAYAVSPRFILSCSEDLARQAAAFAAQHATRIHTHACEHPDEVATVRAEFGCDYIEALADQGQLGPRTGLAHCVHTTAAERALLVEHDVAVLHCPSTNLKLGSGIAPIAAYRDAGLRIALGADGAPCNNRLSALTELRQAALLQSLDAGPGVWPAAAALHALTLGGARALGLDHELGSLEPGKRADIVLLDPRPLAPAGDATSTLVWTASDADVRHVVLGGEIVVRDGAPLTLDSAAIRAEATAALQPTLQRAGLAR